MASSDDITAPVVNDEDKDLLLSRLTQLLFVGSVAGFECGRCHRVLLTHYRANCGHYFCANCKRLITASKSNCSLAHCEKPIEDLDFQDVEFERKLFELRAHCPNKSYGCLFISQLKDLGGHLRVCKDTRDNALPVLIQDDRIEAILRELRDKIDKLGADVTKIDNSLKVIENKAEDNVVEINEKLTECDVNIKNLERRIFALESFDQLRNPQMSCFTLIDDNCNNLQPDFTWTINSIEEKLEQISEITSEVFEWTGYAVKTRGNLQILNNGVAYVSLKVVVGGSVDSKHIPRVYYVLRDRLLAHQNNPRHRCRTMAYLFASKFNATFEFGTALCLKSHLTEPPYNANDSVTVDIYVEPLATTRLVHSYDGTLHWAIDKYSKRKRMEIDYLAWYYESPYFYTGPRGYRVQVVLWLDGWGEYEGKGLTAEVIFLSGEFDDELSSSENHFPHQTTITLLNRKDPERNISKTVVKDVGRELYYFVNVCFDDEIESLIENDVLFFKVTIKPLNKQL